MEKVTGIGGFFFRSRDPKTLALWYQEHLGVALVPTSPDMSPWQQEAGTTAFAPFPLESTYFGDPKQTWMINFRVSNLQAIVEQLRSAGIKVEVNPESYPFGKFARLNDPEGNPIELWEPSGDGK